MQATIEVNKLRAQLKLATSKISSLQQQLAGVTAPGRIQTLRPPEYIMVRGRSPAIAVPRPQEMEMTRTRDGPAISSPSTRPPLPFNPYIVR